MSEVERMFAVIGDRQLLKRALCGLNAEERLELIAGFQQLGESFLSAARFAAQPSEDTGAADGR